MESHSPTEPRRTPREMARHCVRKSPKIWYFFKSSGLTSEKPIKKRIKK
jgi:hypothetical protein